jgi:adenylate kinase family enzyme
MCKDFLKAKDGRESFYVYPGGEYRKLTESGSNIGKLINDSLTRGELQPDFLTTSLVTNMLTASPLSNKHLFFDGYPRSIAQSKSFEEMVPFFKFTQIKIIYIELSKEEAIRRNKLRGRHDDTDEGLSKRFGWYFDNVVPAMNYFKDKENYKIYTINGEQSIKDVHKDIIKALGY